MWPLRVYTRKKRGGQRLSMTPTPDLGPSATVEAPPGPGRRLAAHCWKGNDKAHGLRKIVEKAEQSVPGGSSSGPLSSQLRVMGERSLKENSTSEETQDEKIAPLSESVTDDLQVASSSSDSELVSGLSLQHISSSLLSNSITDSYTEYNSLEESLSSFSSPELFRGSDYLDWECPKLEGHLQRKNSTLLDTSKAVAIEKAPQFSNLSSILGTSSEDNQKCQRKIVMTLADEDFSPKPESTSNSESDLAACEVVLAKKTHPSIPEKTTKKPKKDPEPRDTNFQAKLSSHHLKIKVPSPHWRSVLESNADKSVTTVVLPQHLGPVLNTNSSTRDKKRGLLTSTPSSQTAGLEIDLSSVRKASCEELFPNVSNYVNSDEIVPVSSLQEHSSNEFPSNTSEICCIIRASPGTRQVKSKGVILKKKKYSLPKDIPQGKLLAAILSPQMETLPRNGVHTEKLELEWRNWILDSTVAVPGPSPDPVSRPSASSSEATLFATRRGRAWGHRLKVQPCPSCTRNPRVPLSAPGDTGLRQAPDGGAKPQGLRADDEGGLAPQRAADSVSENPDLRAFPPGCPGHPTPPLASAHAPPREPPREEIHSPAYGRLLRPTPPPCPLLRAPPRDAAHRQPINAGFASRPAPRAVAV
ncbi:meiosis-specific kinetochore protein [Rhinolophus sinicus]|uniref:meiosis-specific kinetochore protein n=1 Tax=Rhinolophus sinicus TaxID=89399 RepID=UPI003D7BAEB0